jgi:hypothetical protein
LHHESPAAMGVDVGAGLAKPLHEMFGIHDGVWVECPCRRVGGKK